MTTAECGIGRGTASGLLPSQQGLGEILSRKLYDSKETPSAADFSDDVKVGFIGTGLPF